MIGGAPQAPGPQLVADALALIRAGARGEIPGMPASRVLDLLDFAEANAVSWAVCDALRRVLPAPAAELLLRPAMAAREARAEALAAQLRALAGLLSEAGLRPVAIKGAAALAEAGGAPVPEREMVDLDLLLPEGDLPAAAAALQAAGYHGETEAWVATDYHFPALFPPEGGGLATVELHGRPGWSRRGPLAGMAARARPSALAGMRVPTPEDRLAHLVQHAQSGDRGYARRMVRLRDMLDWRRIREGADVDLETLAARFDAAGEGRAFRAYAVLMARLWEEPAPEGWAAAHAAWADQAIAALGDPAAAEERARRDRWPAALAALTRRETLMHALAGSLNRARLRRFLRRLGG